jgi:D-alanine-D-alanine ligase
MKIGVAFQQLTAEAKVAQATKTGVISAMQRLGLNFCEIPFTQHFVNDIKCTNVDIIFNAMHGKFGEDGYIQTILNALQVPYTHSGAYASQIGMNKIITNLYAKACGIPTMESHTILKNSLLNEKYNIAKKSVIKPVNGGSSVATFILNEGEILSNAQKEEVANYVDGNLFMIEEYFAGEEVCIGILENKAIGSCKIKPAEEFYSYNAKYHSKETIYETPANISPQLHAKLMSDALSLHNAIGAKVISRVDFIVNNNEYKLLEINTHPGMTATSLIPKICKNAGLEYDDIIQKLINQAEFERIFA